MRSASVSVVISASPLHIVIATMNAILMLTILSLAMPIYGEETQVEKKHDKRGILGLGYGGYGGLGTALAAGSSHGGYGQSYLGGVSSAYSTGHGISTPVAAIPAGYSAPIASHGYNAPLYSSYNRLGYSGGLGYGGSGLGGLGHGAEALGYGAGLGYGSYGAGLGYSAGLGYGARGIGYGAHGGLGAGYGNGW